jgi:rhodanese-related sulfurtransferase
LELAGELSVRGYHNLFVLIGGYLTWEDAGYGMVTGN